MGAGPFPEGPSGTLDDVEDLGAVERDVLPIENGCEVYGFDGAAEILKLLFDFCVLRCGEI